MEAFNDLSPLVAFYSSPHCSGNMCVPHTRVHVRADTSGESGSHRTLLTLS